MTREQLLARLQRVGDFGVFERDLGTDHTVWSGDFFRVLAGVGDVQEPSWAEFLACVHPDDASGVETGFRDAIEAGTVFELEYRVVLPGGAVRHWVTRGEADRSHEGEPARLVGLTHDVTEQADGRLGRGVVHDLRNHLGAITLEASLAQTKDPSPGISRHIERILDVAELAKALTDRLPRVAKAGPKQERTDDQAEPAANDLASLVHESLEGLRILVVEDEVAMRSVLCVSLQVLGAHGHPFADGDAALEYLTKEDRWRDIDLVLADLTIPSGMGGFELARALTERGLTLPVAGISGYWQGHDNQVRDRGLLGVLGKPFDVEELRDFIVKMLALVDDTDRTDTT